MNQHAKMLANSRIEPEAFPLPYRVFESVLVLFWKDSLKLSHSAKSITLSLSSECRPSCVVVRGAGCYTKGPRLEYRVIIYTLLCTSMCFDVQVQYRHEVETFSLLRKIKKNPTFHGYESLMI